MTAAHQPLNQLAAVIRAIGFIHIRENSNEQRRTVPIPKSFYEASRHIRHIYLPFLPENCMSSRDQLFAGSFIPDGVFVISMEQITP